MKKKRERYRIIAGRHNVLQPGKALYSTIKHHWNKAYFHNDNPIVLELACGRGEYTIGLAMHTPHRNFIGMDRKGDRIWKGSTQAMEQQLDNVAFLRAPITDIETFFGISEVQEIWIPFPDPRPKHRDAKRRLTHPRFLERYKKILTPGGIIRLKTDNTDLFQYTLQKLKERQDVEDLHTTFDLYRSHMHSECMDIETRYEKIFRDRGEKIKYLRFRFVQTRPVAPE